MEAIYKQEAAKYVSCTVKEIDSRAKSVFRFSLDGTYYYDGKHRYVFPGAEIPPEEESDCSSDDSSDDSSSDDDDNNPGNVCLHADKQ